MSYEIERERFMVAMEAEGMPREISRRIIRHANTIQRLSVAECNGDWPCDNGERAVISCARCEAGYVRSSMYQNDREAPKPICPNCRAQDLIRKWCVKARIVPFDRSWEIREFVPIFQGDPRGSCVKLKVPSGRTDDSNREGLCVPTRRY